MTHFKYAQIIIPIAHKSIDKPFTYSIPKEMDIALGGRVIVPFGRGNKQYEAYVVGFVESVDFETKDIIGVCDDIGGMLSPQMLSVALWLKEKYHTTMADCLKCILPLGINKGTELKRFFVSLNHIEGAEKLTPPQQKVFDYLKENGEVEQNLLLKTLQISISPVKSLEKRGLVLISRKSIKRSPYDKENAMSEQKVLNDEQKNSVSDAITMLKEGDKKPLLIHGVTGSGKTEVYMEIIDYVLAQGKQAIVLVPEISLTPQTLDRFFRRFGGVVGISHSKLSGGERFDQWHSAKNGDIKVMIGPRSAVFTPFDNLGIIIIDEEHEHSYKSDTSPKYDTREVAIERAKLEDALVILGSATPSVETYYKADIGVYAKTTLKYRVNLTPPKISVIDMREELTAGNTSIFSRDLLKAIEENLEQNKQTILFMNRRGFSTFVSCRKCGHVMACTDCNVNYTYHKYNNLLMCHYCGKTEDNPTDCPICASKFIKYFGVGTQKIEDEIKQIFPQAKILRMDLDTTSKKHAHEQILTQFRNKEADILIGTQMIAKGLDFPDVTLVGVIAADISLNMGDYKSGENTYQLLTQVAGRAGRAAQQGEVFIQTYTPEHYGIVHAKDADYEAFFRHEIALRRQMVYPPFSHVFVVLFTGESEKNLITKLFKLSEIMAYYNTKRGIFEILGPTPAIISKIKNKFRWKIIVKCEDEEKLKNFVLFTIDQLKKIESLADISVNLTLDPATIV